MSRLFALDQGFPLPIVSVLRDYQADAELVSFGEIDSRLPDLEDWEVLMALHHHTRPWDGLITTDDSMLNQAPEHTSETSDQSSTPPPPGRGNVVSGLVPDGISSVVVRFTDGTQQTVPVENNSFILNLGNDPKYLSTVTATADSGARYTE